MHNFKRVAAGLDVEPLAQALLAREDLWNQITLRQDYPGSSHHETRCIFLRGPKAFTFDEYMMQVDAHDYPAMDELADLVAPLMRPLLKAMGATELGYVLAVRLPPGCAVDSHIDEGRYADHYSRFHLAITGDAGAVLQAGGEEQHFAPGEAWWFNHKKLHCARNAGAVDRIHLIFDAGVPGVRVT